MSKNKTKKIEFASKTDKKVLGWFLVVVILVSAALFVFIERHNLYSEIEEYRMQNEISKLNMMQDTDKLRFCLEKSITDCSNTNINKWNEKHPDDRFHIKTFKEVVDEAIATEKLRKEQ